MTMSTAERSFLGVARIDDPAVLVARFVVKQTGQSYYMTMQELCDWIEHQMASGMYYSARENLAVDREALLLLIAAQRNVMSGKKDIVDFAAIKGNAQNFADYVMQSSSTSVTMDA